MAMHKIYHANANAFPLDWNAILKYVLERSRDRWERPSQSMNFKHLWSIHLDISCKSMLNGRQMSRKIREQLTLNQRCWWAWCLVWYSGLWRVIAEMLERQNYTPNSAYITAWFGSGGECAGVGVGATRCVWPPRQTTIICQTFSNYETRWVNNCNGACEACLGTLLIAGVNESTLFRTHTIGASL